MWSNSELAKWTSAEQHDRLSLRWVCGLWFCSDIKLNAMSICMKACNNAFDCCTTMPRPGIDEYPAKHCTYVTALHTAQPTQLVIYVCTPCNEHIERQNSFLPAKVSISLLCLNNKLLLLVAGSVCFVHWCTVPNHWHVDTLGNSKE